MIATRNLLVLVGRRGPAAGGACRAARSGAGGAARPDAVITRLTSHDGSCLGVCGSSELTQLSVRDDENAPKPVVYRGSPRYSTAFVEEGRREDYQWTAWLTTE
jgi:hypothetical protein